AVVAWPGDVLEGGARFGDWVEFRCRRISGIVEQVSGAVHEAKPGIRISAAVFSDWPACRVSVGQDWARWCREGWLDAVFPMNYTHDPDRFASLAAAHREALPARFPLVEGIGINSGQGRMTDPASVALHIVLARQAGASGWCGFCYTPTHTSALFEPLSAWLGLEQGDQP
ncbi:MAG: family 10 glycosylhydrolase, partial [Lentisphaeria bacterium]|nr:family 10 glycosylhydrolase [Lentisphaeria bacterium]